MSVIFNNPTTNIVLLVISVLVLLALSFSLYYITQLDEEERGIGHFFIVIFLTFSLFFTVAIIAYFGYKFVVPQSARIEDFPPRRYGPDDLPPVKPINTNPGWFSRRYREVVEAPDNKLFTRNDAGNIVEVERVYADLYTDGKDNFFRCYRGKCATNPSASFIDSRQKAIDIIEAKKRVRNAPAPTPAVPRVYGEKNGRKSFELGIRNQ